MSIPNDPSNALFEEWLIRYNGVVERKDSMLALTARMDRLVALQMAPGAIGTCQLLQQTSMEMDREESILFQIDDIRNFASKLQLTDTQEIDTSCSVDEFFHMYPECVRNDKPNFIPQEEEEEPAMRTPLGPPIDNGRQSTVGSGLVQRSPEQARPKNARKPSTNPYAKKNPYSRDEESYVSRSINNESHRQPHANPWDAVQSTHNPFQSAQKLYEETHDHIEEGRPSYTKPNQSQNDTNQPQPFNAKPNIPESLKRKFQPPKRDNVGAGKTKKRSSGGGGALTSRPSSRSSMMDKQEKDANDDDELPEELKGLDKELIEKIQNEIMESGETVTFDDIAGLDDAKNTVQELVCWPMKRPDLFTGLRRGPNGLLLFGPPGTGKTLIGKAVAHESGATFFSISSSSLTSKWIGEGEKLVRTLFAVAAYREPAVVFIDEIDSLLTQRKADENEASRRIKTEFLVQLDGTSGTKGRVLVIGATNRPHELDDAARRRFVKRLYIPLPTSTDRKVLLQTLLKKNQHTLSDTCFDRLATETDGFSGADLKALCVEAAMGPLRALGARALEVNANDVPPIAYKHFRQALRGVNPSVSKDDLKVYVDWDNIYGSRRAASYNEDSDDDISP